MGPKISPELESKISTFLELNWSYSVIKKYLKKQNINVSKSVISRINNKSDKIDENEKNDKKIRGKRVLTERQNITLNKWIESPNPPTQQTMANRLNTSQQVISYQINKVLNKKLVKKPKCHALSPKTIEKRWRRSWPLYRRLRCQRWKKVITSDEALFHLSVTNGKTKCQYKTRGENNSKLEVYPKVQFPIGVMVWLGISANGCTAVRFVKPGAKINSDYYINKVLKPFIRRDIPKLYPNGDYLFHQDSAPSHT